MGGLRSLKRSIARNPVQVWIANQKAKKNKDVADAALIEASRNDPARALLKMKEEQKLPKHIAFVNPAAAAAKVNAHLAELPQFTGFDEYPSGSQVKGW